jgi:hypothetical protein
MQYKVTEKSMRPASSEKCCFFCLQKIDDFHLKDCVLINKKVLVRMVVEYEIEMPAHWDKEKIEYNRNKGGWCSDNALEELERLSAEKGCLCKVMRFEYLKDASEPYLKE